jgi:peroxiredoxin Q/BCP
MADKTAALDRKVPDFSLPSTGAKPFKLSAVAGHKLVIYFYPRDNTSGCTKEGLEFRDLHPQFRKAKTVVLGVSTDSLASHEKFKAKYALPFELLCDEEKKACALFDVFKEKSLYGRKYLGVERSTFLIDAQGVLRREWRKVKVDGHAGEVLTAARDL